MGALKIWRTQDFCAASKKGKLLRVCEPLRILLLLAALSQRGFFLQVQSEAVSHLTQSLRKLWWALARFFLRRSWR